MDEAVERSSNKPDTAPAAGWQHFPHDADVGIEGYGATLEEAFANAALAMTAAVTDPDQIRPVKAVEVACQAPDHELLLNEWLNALIYEAATRRMLFSRFELQIEDHRLRAVAWGEPVDVSRHAPAAEVKGATLTALRVRRLETGGWRAQCVVDV